MTSAAAVHPTIKRGPTRAPGLALLGVVLLLVAQVVLVGRVWVALDVVGWLATAVAVSVAVRPRRAELADAVLALGVSGALGLVVLHGPQHRLASWLLGLAAIYIGVLGLLLGALGIVHPAAPSPGRSPLARRAEILTAVSAALVLILTVVDAVMR